MTLIKFKDDAPVRSRERHPFFADLFNDLFETMPTTDFRKSTIPAVNIVESNDSFRLELAAPGLTKDDFKISIENDMLTVSSKKESETTQKDEKFTRREYSFSSFNRSFTLPEIVNAEKISAHYENGVMKVTLPKKDEAKPKTPREVKIS